MNTSRTCDPQELLKLSKSCFAFRSQDASCANWFGNAYRRDRQRRIEESSSGLSSDDIKSMLLRYMVMLDKLFFFGLLTMRDPNAPENRVVALHMLDQRFPNARNLLGEFTSDGSQHRIDIYTHGEGAEGVFGALPLGHLLGTLAHEMVHAYLYLVADHDSAGFKSSWNNIKLGHCQVFWALLNFIMEKLVGWVPECQDLLYQQSESLSEDKSLEDNSPEDNSPEDSPSEDSPSEDSPSEDNSSEDDSEDDEEDDEEPSENRDNVLMTA
ncbi:hypothetical protein KJ359_001772 [Pestalotiopsis sp. 9143b]|nr:hypothetical protein KJ359_001772 [Pestalotiopsis sp. 9143b]